MNRKQLASAIDDIDRQIEELQGDKRELFSAYREANGKAECKAAQAAIKLRQKYADGKGTEIEEHDALVAEIFVEISDRAPRATRSNDHASPERRRTTRQERMDDSMAEHVEQSAELAALGMITPEAHAENVVIAAGMVKKFGTGLKADSFPPDHKMHIRLTDGTSKQVTYAEFYAGLQQEATI